MQAKDIMSSPVVSIRPDATLEEAAQLMLERRISCLLVIDVGGKLLGIVTHSDFGLHPKFIPLAGNHVYTLLGQWASPETIEEVSREVAGRRTKEIMRRQVITVDEGDPVSKVADLMVRKEVHRLPVTRGGEVVGIITRHDLLRLVTEDWRGGGEAEDDRT